jgi:hypothetical protein
MPKEICGHPGMPSIRRFISLIDEGQSADTGVAASDPAAWRAPHDQPPEAAK